MTTSIGRGFLAVNKKYPSAMDMANACFISEKEQFNLFLAYCSGKKNLTDGMKEKNWEKIAKNYNGIGYKKHSYDTKIESEYKKLTALSKEGGKK